MKQVSHSELKKRIARGQSGQALTELLAGIIGILMLFIGFLLISALGTDNIRNTIASREKADRMSESGISSDSGASIRYWDYGEDKLPFTKDDVPVASAPDSMLFNSQFTGTIYDHTGDADSLESARTYMNNISFSDIDQYTVDLRHSADVLGPNMATDLPSTDIFVKAASLADGEERISDTLSRRNLNGLKESMRRLFGLNDFSIIDHTCMPAQKLNLRGE